MVNVLLEVFDEDVSHSRLSDAWISLGPHNSARFTLDQTVVHSVQSSFGVKDVVEVDISVTK